MMFQNVFVCMLICLSFVELLEAITSRPSQVVQTNAGKIQGTTYTFDNGQESSIFLGIRYGKPPVGPLRFKKSVPAEPWTDVKNTTQFGHRCYSFSANDSNTPSEDCLFLNVFAPGSKFNKKVLNKKLSPIAMFIHGGAYVIGKSDSYGSVNIAQYWNPKDVIVVTINYRLQYFGFLALDEETPGNWGLWDMKLALEWIRKNARAFGGDINKITVYGQSAGAMSSDLFTISPKTNRLFNNAIMFAGNSYMNVVTNKIETIRYYAKRFAVSVGFQVNDSLTYEEETDALREFYQNASPETITIGYKNGTNETTGTLLACPTLDGDFLPHSLDVLRRLAPKKPVLAGVTEYEGLLFAASQPVATIYNFSKTYLTTYYPKDRPLINSTAADAIMQTFINTSLPSDSAEFYKQCIVFISDFLFNYPTWKLMQYRAGTKHDTSYLYNLTYFDPASYPTAYLSRPLVGPSHTLEIPYVFGISNLNANFTPNAADLAKLEEFVGALVKFIKTDKPPSSWQKYNANTNKYFWLGQNTTQDGMKAPFGADRMAKWDALYKQYGLDTQIQF